VQLDWYLRKSTQLECVIAEDTSAIFLLRDVQANIFKSDSFDQLLARLFALVIKEMMDPTIGINKIKHIQK